jgi:hypothetical protein
MFKRQDTALREFTKDMMQERVDHLLNTGEEVDLKFSNTRDVREYLGSIGFDEEDSDEGVVTTNGWECSWWIKMRNDEDTLVTIHGDAYDGNLKVYKDE